MKNLTKKQKNICYLVLFMAPAVIIYGFIVIFPIIQSIRFSFFNNWEWITDKSATNVQIGVENWKNLFTGVGGGLKENPFPRSIINSFVLVILSVFVQLPIALFFSLLLARGVKREKFYRTIYFIPVILSAVVVGQLWKNIYRTDAYASGALGMLNSICLKLGIIDEQKQWLVDADSALVCAMVPIVWQYIGQHMLLMYSAAKSVSSDIYEAAKIDGATANQIDLKITIPLMKPILKVSVIWAVTGSLKAFDQLYALMGQNSINDPVKTVPSLLMYREIRYFNFGSASAMAIFIVVECLIFTVIINKMFEERNEGKSSKKLRKISSKERSTQNEYQL